MLYKIGLNQITQPFIYHCVFISIKENDLQSILFFSRLIIIWWYVEVKITNKRKFSYWVNLYFLRAINKINSQVDIIVILMI